MATFADFIDRRLRGLPSPELRKDPVIDRWVIIATDRANRPLEYEVNPPPQGREHCPFCEGHENETPPEVAACRAPDSAADAPGWRVRVVPNRFPALEKTANIAPSNKGAFETRAGFGVHEVIIESPRHERSPADLSVESVGEMLAMYRDRLIDLKRDRRLVYGMIFKNVGVMAGASLEHTHSQLIALPILPVAVKAEINAAADFFDARGGCIFCDIIRRETAHGARIVLDTPGFLVIAPFASCFPFETSILPKRHGSHYESLQSSEIAELAGVLKAVLSKLEIGLDGPPYNYILHTAPLQMPELADNHWHIEITPRLTRTAGFEWGTGFYINPVPPEQAAEFLRETVVADGTER